MTIGVDAEPHDVLPNGVLDAVAVGAERALLARLAAAEPEICWDRLLFSAKESIYKAWYPLTGRWLDFAEAEVTIDPMSARFVARLLVPGPVVAGRQWQEFTGGYVVRNGLVVTAITILA